MVVLVLLLIPVALAIAAPMALVMERAGRRLGTLDTEAAPGQVKAARRAIPNTGGVAIFLAVALPVLGALLLAGVDQDAWPRWLGPLKEHAPGLLVARPVGWALLACLVSVHALGLIDDRRPLPALLKLVVLLVVAAIPPLFTDTRLLTAADAHVGGPWLSVLVTVLWITLVTNAMNFLDNMDGLSAGVGAVAAGCFLAATLVSGQWFIAAVLALLIGALLGFLWRNWSPATLFMGDGGSLVVGYLLGYLTVRTTYYAGAGEGQESAQALGSGWYGVLMPLLVLAVPLYDLLSVIVIRLSQGKSPMVGDLQHTSHRLVKRGLSVPAAVAVLCGLTAVTGFGGVTLAALAPWQAILIGAQCVVLLMVLALFEYSSSDKTNGPTKGKKP